MWWSCPLLLVFVFCLFSVLAVLLSVVRFVLLSLFVWLCCCTVPTCVVCFHWVTWYVGRRITAVSRRGDVTHTHPLPLRTTTPPLNFKPTPPALNHHPPNQSPPPPAGHNRPPDLPLPFYPPLPSPTNTKPQTNFPPIQPPSLHP